MVINGFILSADSHCILLYNKSICFIYFRSLQPRNYHLSKSIVHEIKFGDIAVM